MDNYKNRIAYIDIARGIAIFLVVLGHTLPGEKQLIIYEFHMQLFFIISGLTLKEKEEPYPIKLVLLTIKRRAMAYMLPFVIWGLFYTTLNLKNLIKLLYGSWEMLLSINSLSSLWFLPVLFLASTFSELILWALRRLKKRKYVIFLMCVILLIIGFQIPHNSNYGWPLGSDIAIVGTAFMLIGFLIKTPIMFLAKNKYINALVFIGSISIFLILNQNFLITINMCEAHYGNAALFVIYAFLGSAAVLTGAMIIGTFSWLSRVMSYVGQNTLGILVIHKPIVKYGKVLISEMNFSNSNNVAALYIIALIGELISIMITAVIGKIIPIIIGKKID